LASVNSDITKALDFYLLLHSHGALLTSTVSLPITSISSHRILIFSLFPNNPKYFGLPRRISETTFPEQESTSISLTGPSLHPLALLITSLHLSSVIQQFRIINSVCNLAVLYVARGEMVNYLPAIFLISSMLISVSLPLFA